MTRPLKFTKAQIIEALRNSHGLITGAAEILGVSWNTVDKYRQRYREAQDVIDHWRKRRVDRSEYKLDEAIERGEAWAIALTLKSARDREYSDRMEVTAKVERIEPYDYGDAIAALAPRPVDDSRPPGKGQSDLHGPAVGQDLDGG